MACDDERSAIKGATVTARRVDPLASFGLCACTLFCTVNPSGPPTTTPSPSIL